MSILPFTLFLVGCGTPYDVYGGGDLDVRFDGVITRGFSGTVHAAGAATSSILGEENCEREGFASSLDKYRDDPAIMQLFACGSEYGGGLTESEEPGAFEIAYYGDWLTGETVSDIGAGKAMDHASLWIWSEVGSDTSDPLTFWGTWQLDAVEVTVDDVSGTISGPMEFEEDLDNLDEPERWIQGVTVTWAFDPSVHKVKYWNSGTRLPSPFPTW